MLARVDERESHRQHIGDENRPDSRPSTLPEEEQQQHRIRRMQGRHGGDVVVDWLFPVKSAPAPWMPTWSQTTGMIRVIGAISPSGWPATGQRRIQHVRDVAEGRQADEQRDEALEASVVALPKMPATINL